MVFIKFDRSLSAGNHTEHVLSWFGRRKNEAFGYAALSYIRFLLEVPIYSLTRRTACIKESIWLDT